MQTRTNVGAASFALALLSGVAPITAQAVDGVVLITQARALAGGVTPGDAPGFPVEINVPGSYRLASNLRVGTANVSAIRLNANNVEIDLNGFTLFGPGPTAGTASGIEANRDMFNPGGSAVIVKNGIVRDMGGSGIRLDSSCIVDHVLALGNGGDGIFLTSGAIIQSSEANDNRGHGFHIAIGQVISSNATFNRGDGVHIGTGSSLVRDSVLERNVGYGVNAPEIEVSSRSGYRGNIIADNQVASGPQVAGELVNLGHNLCGGDTGCP